MLQIIQTVSAVQNVAIKIRYVRKSRWRFSIASVVSFKCSYRQTAGRRKRKNHISVFCKMVYRHITHNRRRLFWDSMKLPERFLDEETCCSHNTNHPTQANWTNCRNPDTWRGTGFPEHWKDGKYRSELNVLPYWALEPNTRNRIDAWPSA